MSVTPIITIIIPTHNRSDSIQNIVSSICNYSGYCFMFCFVDSSNDGKTKQLIKDLDDKRVIYFHDETLFNPDLKLLFAIPKVSTKYFWVFGDGYDANFNQLENELEELEFYKYGVINSNPNHNNYQKFSKTYTEKSLFVEDCASLMTLFSAAIVDHGFFLQFGYDKYKELYETIGNGYCFQAAISYAVLNSSGTVFLKCKIENVFHNDNFYQLRHWANTDKLLDVAFVVFQKTYELAIGDKKLLKSIYWNYYHVDWWSFKIGGFLRKKMLGGIINLQNYFKYHFYIRRAKLLTKFFIAAITPKFIIRIIFLLLKKDY